jgi:two-component system OmpR family sensor kinase
VPIVPLLRDVIRASGTLIEEAGLKVEYEAPDTLPAVLGDEQALRRVFQNLVGNAIKYGASGGWIGLSARVNGRELVVTVADRGIGIEPSEQAKIFEPFYRAPQAIAAQIQGAGLGLSLVQRIVEAHGGRITLRSSPGVGSEFTVHLPAAAEEAAERASHVPDPAGTSA